MIDEPRLRATLGRPELAWLVSRVRRRLARGAEAVGTAVLSSPTPAERDAFERFLGRPPSRSGRLVAQLDEIEDVLRRAGISPSLRDAVEALGGAVRNEARAQEERERRWHAVRGAAACALPQDSPLHAWLDALFAGGLLRRLAGGRIEEASSLLAAAVAVLDRLPAGGVPLPVLAAEATGDSHALDRGRPLAAVVRRGVEILAGVDRSEAGAEAWRLAWEAVGVVPDALSTTALVLGLRTRGGGHTARVLDLHAEVGEPCRLSMRQLLNHPPRFEGLGGCTVFVCENPAVVAAAADRLGTACAPLVCTEGQPQLAVQRLVGLLAGAGCEIRYHGDFDWPGLTIANLVVRRFAARPWRFTSADYRRAPAGRRLRGAPVDASWDRELAPAMESRGCAVFEEQVLDDLIADLGAAPRQQGAG